MNNGLDRTMQELQAAGSDVQALVREFLGSLPSHLVLDRGNLVVAHAGLPAELQGTDSPRTRDTALFGTPTGERDAYGIKVLVDWAHAYTGTALVVWGHLPVTRAVWVGNTIDIDTGCVHGGSLTALRYPERDWSAYQPSAFTPLPSSPSDQIVNALVPGTQAFTIADAVQCGRFSRWTSSWERTLDAGSTLCRPSCSYSKDSACCS